MWRALGTGFALLLCAAARARRVSPMRAMRASHRAAAAAFGREVWTPAAQNLNFPHLGQRSPERLADNWRTYAYEMEEMAGLDG